MKDTFYLVGFLATAGLLLFVGRDQLPSSAFLTWGLTFGATTAVGILLISLFRVQLELKESRHQLARKEAELSFAREVQAALFPARLPTNKGLSFSAICIPAQGISGDYYDIIECPDGRIAVAVADISGKGISAAILMSNLQARLRAGIESSVSVPEICRKLNDHLYDFTEPNKYATLFLAQWKPCGDGLEYVNAGHQQPVLMGKNAKELSTGGPPVGLFPDVEYESGTVSLDPGDLLVIYSDGITEAQNFEEEDFGVERLQDLIRREWRGSLLELQKVILENINAWSMQEPQDDMTLVLVRVDDERGSRGAQVSSNSVNPSTEKPVDDEEQDDNGKERMR